MLRLIDTFSGIGGFSYAAERIVGGFETVAFVECEPFCQKVLQKHWPLVDLYDDIKTYSPEPYSADVICAGFPCQDISVAGRQAGIKQGTRSGLFYELMRVIRQLRPQYVVLENVAAITANGLDIVLGEMAEAGYDTEWSCIRASDMGGCHRRDRWWLVAYPNCKQQDRAEDKIQAGRSITATCTASDSNSTGTQGLRPERQLREACEEVTPKWRVGPELLSPAWRSYISEPLLCRGDDGLSNRVDRLRSLGNTVVPQVAAIPLQRIKDIHFGRSI
jgi:DNA (cytosine-5)-methyltransferase 1